VPTRFALDLQLLGEIWIEARGGSLIVISSQTMKRIKRPFRGATRLVAFLARHRAARRSTITIVYQFYGER